MTVARRPVRPGWLPLAEFPFESRHVAVDGHDPDAVADVIASWWEESVAPARAAALPGVRPAAGTGARGGRPI